MSERIEFGSKGAADAAREEFAEHVCPIDDDRRLKTVAFVSDLPDDVREGIETGATVSFADERETYPQRSLTDGEKQTLRRRPGGWNWNEHGLAAMRVKGALLAEGVPSGDWLEFYETGEDYSAALARVEEQKATTAATGAANALSGDPADADEGMTAGERARATEQAGGDGCDHARGHCESGDAAACQFLTNHCGLEQSTISEHIVEAGGAVPFDDLPGEVKGALSRSWNGYKTAVRRLAELLAAVDEELTHAEQAASAIVSIEDVVADSDTSEFRALAGHHAYLGDLAADHAGRLHGQPGAALARREPPRRPPEDPPESGDGTDADDPADGGVAPPTDPTAEGGDDPSEQWVDRRGDRDVAAEAEGTLYEHAENDPEEAADGASETHRRAQNEGYLRGGTRGLAEGVSARDGLGRYTATGGERTLDRFETDDDDN